MDAPTSALDQLDLSKLEKFGIPQAEVKHAIRDAAWAWYTSHKSHVVWTLHLGFYSHPFTIGDLPESVVTSLIGPVASSQ